ncbi:TIGR00730 family Rossman fold protein [Bremerella cremea]|uniref:AMP nucleosidase n=1 Tax=Blastopirellula marina TaxID=124 RepID=A0A2S8FIK8_9BACT|nr:TIGR00730 family Rossman fold protein [Blastopirellula marina]RCS45063.1 TIGR00730 family Rossman fold protein [Bremerella cremea]
MLLFAWVPYLKRGHLRGYPCANKTSSNIFCSDKESGTVNRFEDTDDDDLLPESDDRRTKEINRLLDQIHETADKLQRDAATRGDLKLLSRSLKELRYAFKVFTPYRDMRKLTIFGSARTLPDHPTYIAAAKFAETMAEDGWLVITGAGSGIMEAGHRGAGRKNAMGLNIVLPFEQQANPIIHGDDKLVNMKYFFTRKLMFVKECDAVVCLPGGFGTLDEAFEVLTLVQTGKRDLFPIVLLDAPGGTYWKKLDDFIRASLFEDGMISPEDFALYRVTDRVEEAVEEIEQFYKVYHSMRYVRNRLVIRLQTTISDKLFNAIRSEFQDILSEGDFEIRSALPEEDEPDLEALPRLVFTFNRRNLGRLRLMIDCLNADSLEPASREPI